MVTNLHSNFTQLALSVRRYVWMHSRVCIFYESSQHLTEMNEPQFMYVRMSSTLPFSSWPCVQTNMLICIIYIYIYIYIYIQREREREMHTHKYRHMHIYARTYIYTRSDRSTMQCRFCMLYIFSR